MKSDCFGLSICGCNRLYTKCRKNSKCTGYWQVYGDEQAAMRKFTAYRKCSEVYKRLWNSGRSVLELTVAA